VSSPREPYDSRDIEELAATDALLDRIGARDPSPGDLDDPVVAALALMAAEIDLDAVPVEVTRAALAAARPDLLTPPATPPHPDEPGLVLDLRDGAGQNGPAALPVRRDAVESDAVESDAEPEPWRRPRGRPRRPDAGPSAMAPPRSLPRMHATGPAGTRPGEKRERRLRPMTVLVVAIAAIVLGSGVSAVLTGGRSVNPLNGIQQVVEEITHGRTTEQAAAFRKAEDEVSQARAAAKAGDRAEAERLLDGVSLQGLTSDDRKQIAREISDVRSLLRR
jgi:hypothetical protein